MRQKSESTRSGNAGEVKTLPSWVDLVVLFVVVVISLFSIGSTLQATLQGASLFNDQQLSWHLVRAAGMTAYSLLAASTVWGLFLSSRAIANWTPGPVSLLFHATVSWLAVVLSIAHVGLLLFDTYYHYTLADLLVPFIGPYRPLAVGLGIIAFWLTLAVTVSFSMRKLIGQKRWLWLHYTSYAAFGLVSLHALTAGTDGGTPGMLIILVMFSAAVVILLGFRLTRSRRKSSRGASSILSGADAPVTRSSPRAVR